MEHVLQDVRFGLRLLLRSPGFAIAALICITLGVGVTTTIFSALHGILLRPLPFPAADELVVVHSRNLQLGITDSRVSMAEYTAWKERSHSVTQLGAWVANFPTITGEGEPERIDGALISANVFAILGIRPFMGREFLPTEERPGSEREIVLSYGLWQRRYGGERAILGHSIQLSGQPYEVVGVMPPGFSFPEGVQMWTPLAIPDSRFRDRFCNGAIGRLKPGVKVDQANTELAGLSLQLQTEMPKENTGWDSATISLRDELVGVLRKPVLIFQAAAVLVLLIACANVANLVLARGAGREREIAVRTAVGANRRRIFTQVVTESIVLGVTGGIAGAFMAYWGVRLLALAFPDGVPSYIDLSVDATVLFFTTIVALLTGIIFGLAPAVRAIRVDLVPALREGGRNTGAGRVGRMVRSGLILVEVALSLVLIIAAVLLVRSDLVLERELGFQPRGVLSIRIPVPMPRYVEAKGDTFYDSLFARIRALPGVQSVGSATIGIPLLSVLPYSRQPVVAEGSSPIVADEGAIVHEVSVDFFDTLRVPVIQGRGFRRSDLDSTAPSAIVNETFVRRYFGGASSIAKRVQLGNESVTIVGVVRDFRQDRPPLAIAPAIYPYRPFYPGGQTLVVRTSLENPLTLVPSIRAIVRDLDPTLVAYMTQTMDQAVDRGLWRQRLQARVLEIFAGLAVILATFGIYGVISFTVAQRTHEVGLRKALGATRLNAIALVVKETAWLSLIGVTLGIVVALGLTRFLKTLLYGVESDDPGTFIGASVLLGLVTVLAAIVPARRASRVDPMIALRSE